MYDAVIVGARCAGSPTAMLLARQGHKVLLLDRARFPSDTYSTHFIQLDGMSRLLRWGLLERLMATGCPPITTGSLDIDGQVAAAEFPLLPGIPGLASPRRTILDKLLVDAAVEAGAELREGAMVDKVLIEDGRAVGVVGHSSEGPFEVRAHLIIGADGRSSVIARSVGAGYLENTPALGGGYYSYWSGVDCTAAELFLYDGQFTVAFPTHDGLTTIAMAVRPEEFVDERKHAEEHVTNMLRRLGDFGERALGGERVHDLISIGNLSNFLREPWGPGWALAGDAAYHKDPSPAEGIGDAFRGADLLAAAAHEVFTGAATEEAALGRYGTEFEMAARPHLEKTLTMSSFEIDPLTRATAFLELSGMHFEDATAVLSGTEEVPA